MSASESRSAIVLELAEEFLERYRQGQRPSLKEYIDCHPELAAEIKEVFPAMALMENVALADESLAGEATGPATTPESVPPTQLGDYRILREIGRGGMGIVYEAEQVSLGRHVALKVLPRKMFVDDAQRHRFEREAKAAARLHHTNIVPVFGVGEHDGLPYYVMQFIQGLGLDDVLDELKRMQGSGTATATDGQLHVARKDVSAVDVARSLLTGAFPEGERGCVSAPSGERGCVSAPCEPAENEPALGALTRPRSPESGTSKLSDSFRLSSSLHLTNSGVKGKKLTYWQSVARLGVQVADALEYAHKQGIQHRDIKPSNLLLDTRGTVWVADFGLARADNEDHLTQTGDIVGTLRYMPPEAFERGVDKRGDIYSLGLSLYEMLALKPAFADKDRHKLIKRVTTEEPARLDKLNHTIPRDLVTIVHKAIDREPARRYATAGELAADLQRFLDDEPIQARRLSNRERLWRWCRHHPGVAMLTGLLVLLLVGVTAASLLTAAHFDRVALHEAQAADNERLAREEAEQAKLHEAELRGQAEDAKRQAEQRKQQAESNFAKARRAVDSSFTTVSESQLLKVPGMQPLRRDLLQSALTFYQDFLKERGDDPALRGELAAAFLRVGKIRSELEERAEARKAYEQARELYEALTKVAPESVEWRHGLAQCYYRLGRNDEAIALWEKLVQPGKSRFQKELADAYNSRAIGHSDADRIAEVLQAHQQALAIREMLVRLNPDDPDAQRDLSVTLHNIGFILGKKNRPADALVMYRWAAEHGEAAFARAPQVISNGRALAVYQKNIAFNERQLRHPNEAVAAFRRVVEVRQKLARDNPAIPSLHGELFNAYSDLARYQRELKQTEQAERTMRLAREVIERMPSDGPDALYRVACAWALCLTLLGQGKDRATAEEQGEQKQEADLAMEALSKAIAAGFRDLAKLHKDTDLNALRGREDFKALQADLAARVAAAPADKLKASQQALALRQKLAQADPKNKRLQADQAASQHALALIQLDLGKYDEAQKHLQQAIALREALVKDEPNNAQYQADMAANRLALELIRLRRLVESKRPKETEAALKLFARIADDALLARLTAAIERDPKDMERRWNRGEWHARHARWKEAAADFTIGLESRMALVSQAEGKAEQWLYVAPVLAAAGDREGYRRLCREMLKRFGDTQEPTTAERTAKACLLLPEFAKEMQPACELADRAASLGKTHSFALWFLFCKGLSDYRRGNFRAAIEGLDALVSQTERASNVTAQCHLVLAMALHQQGNAKAAREHLTQAAKLLNEYLLDPVRSPILKDSYYHHDWSITWLLHREAQTLIEGEKGKSKE